MCVLLVSFYSGKTTSSLPSGISVLLLSMTDNVRTIHHSLTVREVDIDRYLGNQVKIIRL